MIIGHCEEREGNHLEEARARRPADLFKTATHSSGIEKWRREICSLLCVHVLHFHFRFYSDHVTDKCCVIAFCVAGEGKGENVT